MAIQTTSNLSNAIRTKYISDYIRSAEYTRVYDQFAEPVGKQGVEEAAFLGNQIDVNFLSDMEPGTSTISEVQDVVPSALRDATASITPTSRWGALQWAEGLELKAYTDYGKRRFEVLGKNQAESIDLLAQAAALQGTNIFRAAARASLDAGTSGHNLTDTILSEIDAEMQALHVPSYPVGGRSMWNAVMPPAAYHDIRLGGNVVSVAHYQDKRIVLNFELGEVGPFRLISNPWAKVFLGAGADNASSVDTTLNGAVNALDKTIIVDSASNISVGDKMMIGTEETGDTHHETNEQVRVGSVDGTTIGVIGAGANGGLRFDHADGVAVRNADNVYPVAFGGPSSLAKLFDLGIGEFGQVVGPKVDGTLDQFKSIGWKFYGDYGRWVESWVLRGEFSSSLDA